MPPSPGWLIDEMRPLTPAHLDELDRELADAGPVSRGGQSLPTLAVALHDVVIHDNRKWFGEANVRIDALVVTGYGAPGDPSSFYLPKTASFPCVRDGDRLPIGEGGWLVFHGPVAHFVDFFIMVSRDRGDTQDLSSLLSRQLGSDETKSALAPLLGLAIAAPQVAAVTASIAAAGVLGNLALRALHAATGATIGIYRNSHLQTRDGFGVGRHPGPARESYRVKDLSFRYEIAAES
jgi:hypothetical protein